MVKSQTKSPVCESSDRTCTSRTTSNGNTEGRVGNSSSCCSMSDGKKTDLQRDNQYQDWQPGKLTRTVNSLRVTVMLFFLSTATMVCVGVFKFTKEGEIHQHEQDFEDNALRIVRAFHDATERKLEIDIDIDFQYSDYFIYRRPHLEWFFRCSTFCGGHSTVSKYILWL